LHKYIAQIYGFASQNRGETGTSFPSVTRMNLLYKFII